MEQTQQHEEPGEGTTRSVQSEASEDTDRQAQTEQALQTADTEGLRALLDLLQREAEKRKRRTNVALGLIMLMGLVSVPFLLAIIILMIYATAPGGSPHLGWAFRLSAASPLIATLIWTGVFLMEPSRRAKKAFRTLAQCDDVRAVGPLAETLSTWQLRADRAYRNAVVSQLKRLLPRLQPSDAIGLTPVKRNGLYGVLIGKDTELILTILKALEQVGDSTALPFVQALAQDQAPTLTPQERTKQRGVESMMRASRMMFMSAPRQDRERIRAAAQECLPYLQGLAQKDRERRNLLRPAEAADVLLRPASGTVPTPSDRLLSAGTPEREPEEKER